MMDFTFNLTMKNLKKLLPLVVILIAITTSSCKKQMLDRIHGKWKLVDIAHMDDPRADVYWEFDNSSFTISNSNVTGEYVIQTNFNNSYLVISKLNPDPKDNTAGKWNIVNLNKQTMTIINKTGGGQKTREFEKVD